MSQKPTVRNPDGNVFFILGACQKALRKTPETLERFKAETQKAMNDGETDYHGMLEICMKYVSFEIDDEDDNA